MNYYVIICSKKKINDFLNMLEGFKNSTRIIDVFSPYLTRLSSHLLKQIVTPTADKGTIHLVVILFYYCCNIVVILFYYCCNIVVLLLYYCCIIVVILLYYCCIIVVLLLYYCCIIVVILLYYCCIIVVLLLYYCCITVVLMLYYCCIVLFLLGLFPDLKDKLHFFDTSFDHQKARSDGAIIPRNGVNNDYDTALQNIEQIDQNLDDYIKQQKKRLHCKVTR